MSFTFRPAQRSATKPLIGLYGPSGSGKTFSALTLARGFVGPQGRLGMIDTESGRGQLYSDVIPGGYDVLTLGEPFTPARYIEAIRTAEKAGLDALVIDSFSHEWEGVGGVLDMATEIERKTGKPGLHCWKEPKLEHQKLVLRLLQTPLLVICCLRAKYRSRQIKNERTGKNEIIRDENATAIQDDGFLFELTVNAELRPDHTMIVTKTSHPALASIFRTGQAIAAETGRALADWAKGGAQPATADPADLLAQIERCGTLDALDALRESGEFRAVFKALSPADKTRVKNAGQAKGEALRARARHAGGESETRDLLEAAKS